jgi:hypothetical protein
MGMADISAYIVCARNSRCCRNHTAPGERNGDSTHGDSTFIGILSFATDEARQGSRNCNSAQRSAWRKTRIVLGPCVEAIFNSEFHTIALDSARISISVLVVRGSRRSWVVKKANFSLSSSSRRQLTRSNDVGSTGSFRPTREA